MVRTVAGVIIGYVALFAFIVITFSLFFLITGPSFAWETGTTRASAGWMAGAIILSFLGAVAGGWVAAKIGRSMQAVYGLAGLIIVLGLVSAVMSTGAVRELPQGRSIESLGVMEAAQYTIQPAWYNYLVPVLGAVGVLLGGRRVRKAAPAAGDLRPTVA